MMREANQQVGKILPFFNTVNVWLWFGAARNNSLDQWATNEPEEVHLFRTTLEASAEWVYLRHFQLALGNGDRY